MDQNSFRWQVARLCRYVGVEHAVSFDVFGGQLYDLGHLLNAQLFDYSCDALWRCWTQRGSDRKPPMGFRLARWPLILDDFEPTYFKAITITVKYVDNGVRNATALGRYTFQKIKRRIFYPSWYNKSHNAVRYLNTHSHTFCWALERYQFQANVSMIANWYHFSISSFPNGFVMLQLQALLRTLKPDYSPKHPVRRTLFTMITINHAVDEHLLHVAAQNACGCQTPLNTINWQEA